MSLKHVGYAVVDKNNDLLLDDSDNLIFDELIWIRNVYSHFETEHPDYAPYKIVRVLIDDEVGND